MVSLNSSPQMSLLDLLWLPRMMNDLRFNQYEYHNQYHNAADDE